MPTITVDGRKVFYAETKGREPAVVLVHSSGLDRRQWGGVRLALESGRRVIIPDLPGYGRSAPFHRGDEFSLDDDIRVVTALLELTEEPVVLVGHSYGGFLALKAAARAPDKVAAVLVHEPVIWGVFYGLGDEEKIQAVERANRDGRFMDPVLGGTEPWFRGFIEIWGGPGAWDALPRERRDAFLAVGPKVFAEVRALTSDRTPVAEYAALSCPVVVTVGEGTQPLELDACRALAATAKGVRLVEIPGGHVAPIAAPAPFVAELRALLAG